MQLLFNDLQNCPDGIHLTAAAHVVQIDVFLAGHGVNSGQ